MDKKEVIKHMGRFPDKIIDRKTMKSNHWKCSKCNKDYISNKSVINPAPCKSCDGIFFQTVNKESNE